MVTMIMMMVVVEVVTLTWSSAPTATQNGNEQNDTSALLPMLYHLHDEKQTGRKQHGTYFQSSCKQISCFLGAEESTCRSGEGGGQPAI